MDYLVLLVLGVGPFWFVGTHIVRKVAPSPGTSGLAVAIRASSLLLGLVASVGLLLGVVYLLGDTEPEPRARIWVVNEGDEPLFVVVPMAGTTRDGGLSDPGVYRRFDAGATAWFSLMTRSDGSSVDGGCVRDPSPMIVKSLSGQSYAGYFDDVLGRWMET